MEVASWIRNDNRHARVPVLNMRQYYNDGSDLYRVMTTVLTGDVRLLWSKTITVCCHVNVLTRRAQ